MDTITGPNDVSSNVSKPNKVKVKVEKFPVLSKAIRRGLAESRRLWNDLKRVSDEDKILT